MTHNRLLYILPVLAMCIAGCSRAIDTAVQETIPFSRMTVKEYDDMPAGLLSQAKYIILKPHAQEDMFKEIDKIVYSSGKLYILDWFSRKIVVLDETGNPVSVLAKSGRGPGEYLQITDFDVDDSGNILVVDGRKDQILKYSPDMKVIGSRKLPFEVESIKSCSPATFHFGLSPWDTSRYKDRSIVTVDTSLSVIQPGPARDRLADPDYSFPSAGFTDARETVLYHRPINDNVYRLSPSGKVEKVYTFDFGNKAVPDQMKTDIERYREEFDRYNTLVKSVYIDSTVVAGSLMQGRVIRDFIIDRIDGKVYMQESPYESLQVVGISGGFIVYRILYGEDIPENIYPEDVIRNVSEGNDVLALVKISSLFRPDAIR